MSEKILIVDDDVDTLKLVGLMLQRQGYEIVAANNGTQGLDKAADERPDLILLDVMMPDMDGYEVTRRLRADPGLAHIPIIMFTAKTLVDDKVAGFEAGADDYLTKPTHPAELTAHVKAVLARATASRATPGERAYVVGFIGARGGIGTTTLAANTAVALAQEGQDVIAAELTPGRGNMGPQLGFMRPTGLTTLLKKRPEELTSRIVEGQVVSHGSGVRLLLSSYNPSDAVLLEAASQMETIVRHLAALCKVLVLDLGAGLPEATRRAIGTCDRVIVPLEPSRISLTLTEALIADLETIGVGQGRTDMVLMNRTRSSVQLTITQVEQRVGRKMVAVVTPAPELAYQATDSGVPMVVAQPNSITADQFAQLARRLVPQA